MHLVESLPRAPQADRQIQIYQAETVSEAPRKGLVERMEIEWNHRPQLVDGRAAFGEVAA